MLRTDLRAGWSDRAIGGDQSGRVPGTYPAEVPGCVHTDLMAAGVIPDPYLDGNEAALRWMHEIDWRYAVVLEPHDVGPEPPGPEERVDLVFDGIDTVATVWLGAMHAELVEAQEVLLVGALSSGSPEAFRPGPGKSEGVSNENRIHVPEYRLVRLHQELRLRKAQ